NGLAGVEADLEAVAAAHSAWREAEEAVRELERLRDRGAREREFAEWQLGELRRAGLRAGEDEELAAERSVSRHAVRLSELTQGAREGLEGGEETLRAAAEVRSAAELDPRLLPL